MRVYTGGTFDQFHSGHRDLLRYCRHMAGEQGTVIVGLNRDAFISRYKGHAPAQGYGERQRVLLDLRSVTSGRIVDMVVANIGDEDSRPAIEGSRPDVVVIGSDWHEKDYLAQLGLDFDWLHEHRIVLAYAPRPSDGPSTSGAWA